MSFSKVRAPLAAVWFAAMAMLSGAALTYGQAKDEAEEGRFRTADGLRLNYQWFAGGKGQKSDCVMLIPKYGYDSTKAVEKGQWANLAKALQKEGYSVLMFDFRGHGKSADFRTMDKPDVFCKPENSFNRFSGQTLNSKFIKQLDKAKFSPSYYPFLVNDITAARRFLDDQNDGGQCNSGRVFVIAEQDICPLVMLWASTEFSRYAFGPKTRQDDPEKIHAGEDLCGLVFLSWQNSIGMTGTAASVAGKVMADKELGSDSITIFNQLKKKVAMAFIYGKEDRSSAAEARFWFSKFGIPAGKTQDAETVKYIREIAGAEKLTGIKLLDIPDKANGGASLLEGQIVDFLKSTKTKAISGNNWKERKMENLDAVAVPLDIWGLKWMK